MQTESHSSAKFGQIFSKQLASFQSWYRIPAYFILAWFFVHNVLKAWCLKINAHDYGIQVVAAKNALLHGNFYCDVINMNYLGDHFSPTLLLISPLLLLGYHPVVMLLFQNILLLLVFFIIYRIFRIQLGHRNAEFATLCFTPNLFINEVFVHDFHIEALGAVLFLQLVYQVAADQSGRWSFWLIFLMLCGVKEDVALVLTFFGIALFLQFRKWNYLLVSLFSLCYFLAVVFWLMPYFSDGVITHIGRYKSLGANPEEIVQNVVADPFLIFNQIKWPEIKWLFDAFYYLPFLCPLILWAACVPIFYNTISDYPIQYKFWWVHSYLIFPIFFLCIFRSIGWAKANQNLFSAQLERRFKWLERMRAFGDKRLSWVLILVGFSILVIPNYKGMFDSTYSIGPLFNAIGKNFEVVQQLRNEVKFKIPAKASVAATSELQPHLLEFPYAGVLGFPENDSLTLQKAEYLILFKKKVSWPFSDSLNYDNYIQKLGPRFLKTYESRDLMLMRRQ